LELEALMWVVPGIGSLDLKVAFVQNLVEEQGQVWMKVAQGVSAFVALAFVVHH
jgi:hypothetical protein